MHAQGDVQKFILDHLRARYPKARAASRLEGDTNLISSGIIDSFGFLELVAEVEQKFSVEIDVSAHDFDVIVTPHGLSSVVTTA